MKTYILLIMLFLMFSQGLSKAQDYYPSPSEVYYATQQTVNSIINSSAYNSNAYNMNREQRASSYFKARQLNRYYTELEQLQRKELNKMKRDGSLDAQNLNRLFNMNY